MSGMGSHPAVPAASPTRQVKLNKRTLTREPPGFPLVQKSTISVHRNPSQKRGFLRGYVEPEKLRMKVA
jgi:hypothetical protein